MKEPQVIFVTGASGNQGTAAVCHLAANGFHVKALTRNPAKAMHLAGKNVEIVQGDLNKPHLWEHHVRNVSGIFCVLTYENGIDKETRQGKTLIDLAGKYKVPHFVYSSVIANDLKTGIPHWDSKFIIENYLKASGLNHTILRPASLFENLLIPQVKKAILRGKLVMPLDKETIQNFIASDDIGRIASVIFRKPDQYLNQTIALASERLDLVTLASLLSECLNMPVKNQKLPGFITRLVMGKGLYKMFKWVNEHDTTRMVNHEKVYAVFPGMTTLREWIPRHFPCRDAKAPAW